MANQAIAWMQWSRMLCPELTRRTCLQVRRFSILLKVFSAKTGELLPDGSLNRLAIKKQSKYGSVNVLIHRLSLARRAL